MLDASGVGCDTGVLEIGPGIGTLTRELSARAARVAAVEIDRALLPVLAETLADCENTRVYHADALKLDLPAFCREALPAGSSPSARISLLYHDARRHHAAGIQTFFASHAAFAARSCGASLRPSRRGRLLRRVSALVRYYAEPKLFISRPRGLFYPPTEGGVRGTLLTPVAADVSPGGNGRSAPLCARRLRSGVKRCKTRCPLPPCAAGRRPSPRSAPAVSVRMCAAKCSDRRFLQAGRCSAGLIGEVRYGTTRIARYPNSRYRRSGF